MKIELCTMDDIKEIRELWKQGKPDLGIPFTSGLKKLIDSNRFFCTKNENGKIVSFCGYKIMKRNPEIRICHLLVSIEERNKHIATEYIKHIVKETNHLNLPLVVHCRDGADNNSFYEKYKLKNYTIITRDSGFRSRVYELDKSKFK